MQLKNNKLLHKLKRHLVLYFNKNCTFIDGQPTDTFITTPIFYINSTPHIGHLYTAVLADAFWRWKQLVRNSKANKYKPIFLTGTDEHGQKIYTAAQTYFINTLKHHGVNDELLQQYCDIFSQKFKSLFSLVHIDYNTFNRTTDKRHHRVVEWLWNRIKSRGYIYPGTYDGWYSIADEEFISPSENVTELSSPEIKSGQKLGVCVSTGQKVVWVSEPNYLFSLESFGKDLTYWLSRDDVITPSAMLHVARSHLDGMCRDISVSRSRDKVPWAVPVPGDHSQTIYVWFDALATYLTATGLEPEALEHEFVPWPPTHQFLGKDILKFHAIIWPAILLAAGLKLPQKLICHSHWLMEHQKMSKSKGNVVDPFLAIQSFGGWGDGIRFALLRETALGTDCNYDERRLKASVNADLANTLGNLYSRAASLASKIRPTTPGGLSPEDWEPPLLEYEEKLEGIKAYFLQLPSQVEYYYEKCSFHRGLGCIMDCLRSTNETYHSLQPWKGLKTLEKKSVILESSLENAELSHFSRRLLLNTVHNALRISAILLGPVIPILSQRLMDGLGIKASERTLEEAKIWKIYTGDIAIFNDFEAVQDDGILTLDKDSRDGKHKIKGKPVLYQRMSLYKKLNSTLNCEI